MLYDNFAMLTKRELLIRIVKLLKDDELVTKLKYLPIEMRPRNKKPVRCCVHKDRYILKHKIISLSLIHICFQIGSIQLQEMCIALIDLDYVNTMYKKHLNRKVIGLLGSDFCIRHGIIIDYPHLTLTISRQD